MRLIDADDLEARLDWSGGQNLLCVTQYDIRRSKTIDTVSVPVIRCKDCMYYHTEECCMDDIYFLDTKDDDFCSLGKRRG